MKWFKVLASVLIVLIIVATIAMVSLATFVSPNRFKPLLVEQVKKYTGRDLTISGDLSWTLFPTFGVKIGHLELSNPAGFKQKTFAEMDSATVSVKILPLLHAKVESDGVTLKGLKVNLIKNAKGLTNWADLQKPSSEKVAATVKEETVVASPKRAALGLAISGIDVSNASITWENEQANQHFDINHFELHLKNITLTQPIPFKTSFDFVGQNPNVQGKLVMTSDISLNLETELYALHNIDLSLQLKQDAKNFPLVLKGDVVADMAKQKLQLDNLVGHVANLAILGKVNVNDLSGTPKSTGHLTVQPFDVKQWLKETGQDVASVDTLKNLSGEFDFTAGTTLASAHLEGAVKIDEVKASKMTVTNINVHTELQKGVLALAPITAAFYQGNVTGNAKVNLNNPEPQITANINLANMQAEPLMTDLASSNKIKLAGAGNVDVQITTSGSGDALTKNLNGNLKLSFNNGVIKGVDIGYLIDKALSFARKQTVPTNDTNQTPFGTLTATAVIHNGLVTNDDLKMDSPRFETTGKGRINLVSQQIHYQLQAQVKKAANDHNELANMYGLPLPISIAGDLSSPTVALDTDALMKALAQQQIQKAKSEIQAKVQEKIKDKIKDRLPEAGALINNLLGH
jgi:AsmA protein